jgi:hypothetical protein
LPEIHAYYDSVLADFSVNDVAHTLHYLLKLLDNMKRLDESRPEAGKPPETKKPRQGGAVRYG